MAPTSKSNDRANNGEVATNGATSGTIVKDNRARLARIVNLMAMEATAEAEDQTFKGDDILDIFEAETKEDMYEADNKAPLGLRDLPGCELEIVSVTVKFSKKPGIDTIFITEDGKKMFLWVSAFRTRNTGSERKNVALPPIGEVFNFNTSARYAVAKLLWLYTHGEVDITTGRTEKVYVEGTEVEDGEVIKLRPVAPVTVSQ